MSMKFLSGLQDLLGMYDAAVPAINSDQGSVSSPSSSSASICAPSHLSQLSSPSLPIPPILTRDTHNTNTSVQRKRSAQEVNRVESIKREDEPIRKCSHNRNVHFPDEEELVTGYHEAPRSPFTVILADGTTSPACSPIAPDPEEMIIDYRRACRSFNTQPIPMVLSQIRCFHRVAGVRQETLSLKGERIGLNQMESLESILKKVQFESIDFEYTFLDDETAISLGEMIEFYDSAHRLNLSFNKAIQLRGWSAIFKAVKNCSSLNVLNLRYTSLSDKSIPSLCRTLRGTPPIALSTIHLENVSLSGKGLLMVVCALKANTTIKELYLGENSLQPSDGAYLYQLIVSNSSIQMLDLRNNQLHDGGLRHICDGLKSTETREKSQLSALVLWNNRLTGSSMDSLANALMANDRLETLNIGCNRLGVEGVQQLKKALQDTKCNLHRLGLQSTSLDCQAAIELAECLAENTSMVRVDLRDNNEIASAGLLALHSAMKMNKTITLLNIDSTAATTLSNKSSNSSSNSNESRRESPSIDNNTTKPYQEEFRRLYDEIREACERNKASALAAMSAHVDDIDGVESPMGGDHEEDERKDDNEGNNDNEKRIRRDSGGRNDGDIVVIDNGNDNDERRNEYNMCNGDIFDQNSLASTSIDSSSISIDDTSSIPSSIIPIDSISSSIPSNGLSSKSKKDRKWHKFSRSTSLTCTETVVDINERIREMSHSSQSLDETSNADSIRTIRKPQPEPTSPSIMIHAGELSKRVEFSSLPSIPASIALSSSPSGSISSLSSITPSKITPVVRKMRRFSVSPTSSTFELTPTTKSTIRPSTLSLDLFSPPSSSLHSPSSSSSSSSRIHPTSAPVVLSPPKFDTFANVRSPIPDRFRITTSTVDNAVVNSPVFTMNDRTLFSDIEMERDVRAVVTDLINYILYEEQSVVERKRSMLLTTLAPPPRLPSPSRSIDNVNNNRSSAPPYTPLCGMTTPSIEEDINEVTTPMTPSRMLSVAEEVSSIDGSYEDGVVVRSMVQSMIREVVKSEKMAELKKST